MPPVTTAVVPGNSACVATQAAPRRLTQAQLVGVLTESVRTLVNDTALAQAVPQIVNNNAQFPADKRVHPDILRHGGFTRLDAALGTPHAEAMFDLANRLAGEMTANSTRVSALLRNCSGSVDACLTSFVQRAGRLLLRRPMTTADTDFYRALAGSSTSATSLARVLSAMIASPEFLFIVELGQPTSTGSCKTLTANELANRLALHFWNSVPDQQLLDAADNGSLLTPTVYRAQVERMVADARAESSVREFFRQWFWMDELRPFDGRINDPKFTAFAGSYRPQASTRDAAINETLDMVVYNAARNADLRALVTDRRSFARTSDIATLYNVPVWNGNDTPPTFPDADRVGLLTRVGFLANGSADTTLPITRGYRVLAGLLCQRVPPPPDNTINPNADLSGLLSTRERLERLTEMAGTSCRACHAGSLNPWGFVMEGFDALGRVRTSEVIRDASGAQLGVRPLNTSTTLVAGTMAPRTVSTAAQAQQYVLDSGLLEGCFAREYFRYTFARTDIAGDANLIGRLAGQARGTHTLRGLMAAIALQPEFTSVPR